MRFRWTPAKENEAKKFTVKSGSRSIVMLRDQSYSFETPQDYAPFKERMEALVRTGEVALEARDYKAPAPKKAKPAPAPAPEATTPAPETKGTTEEAPASDGLEDKTVAELKEMLDAKGTEYAKSAKKADLVALLRG
jgi:hypothetical protein